MSDQMLPCPKCESPYGYFMATDSYCCPDCQHQWNPNLTNDEASQEDKVLDSNGNELQNGDTVIVIKDLPVKGAPKPVKAGTKVKNIRLVEGNHDISCKITGFGVMGLKSEFVRKAN